MPIGIECVIGNIDPSPSIDALSQVAHLSLSFSPSAWVDLLGFSDLSLGLALRCLSHFDDENLPSFKNGGLSPSIVGRARLKVKKNRVENRAEGQTTADISLNDRKSTTYGIPVTLHE